MARLAGKVRGKKERYLVDEEGKRIAVVLHLAKYRQLIAHIEELEDLRAFDAAKASGDAPIPRCC